MYVAGDIELNMHTPSQCELTLVYEEAGLLRRKRASAVKE